jgi:hypothetical protein
LSQGVDFFAEVVDGGVADASPLDEGGFGDLELFDDLGVTESLVTEQDDAGPKIGSILFFGSETVRVQHS